MKNLTEIIIFFFFYIMELRVLPIYVALNFVFFS